MKNLETFLCVENVRLLQYPMYVTNTPDIKTSVHQTSYCQGSLLDVRKHFLTKGFSFQKLLLMTQRTSSYLNFIKYLKGFIML